MGQVLVRGLDDTIIERLRQRAESHHRSLEAELRKSWSRCRGRWTSQRRGTWRIEFAASSRAVPTAIARN